MELEQKILSVSALNQLIKSYLDTNFPMFVVEGEVSNLAIPASGHFYFSLKDEKSQLRSVHFKSQHNPKVALKNGLKILCYGRVSLYEARGDYQFIIEKIELAGLGQLHIQFEALKLKLQTQGVFDSIHKKQIPKIPNIIGVITSATGAAIRDILSTLQNRFPMTEVLIYPADVQGKTAHLSLINSIRMANRDKLADVIILARGGGSIEDLWSFNEETLAMAIYESSIPIISGVGHETDFTIADFVADLRAPTPTAAATFATPHQDEFKKYILQLQDTLISNIRSYLHTHTLRIQNNIHQLTIYKSKIYELIQYLDNLLFKLEKYINEILVNKNLQNILSQLQNNFNHLIFKKEASFKNLINSLNTLSPLNTLARGYTITQKDNEVIKSINEIKLKDNLKIIFKDGTASVKVCNINHY